MCVGGGGGVLNVAIVLTTDLPAYRMWTVYCPWHRILSLLVLLLRSSADVCIGISEVLRTGDM